jgi:2-amino-4-hydroxy-6-hydroxymethyldihydropteridine diphosphokinase
MSEVFLSLGSNMGDRESNLEQAVKLLKGSGKIKLLAMSSLYETEPVGAQGHGDFFNCVIKIKTDLNPHELLSLIKSIEAEMGREANTHLLPRPIDIDILLYDDLRLESVDLRIPHSRLKARRFVLEPLLEIAPGRIDPETGRPLSEFLEDVKSQKATKVRN